MTRNTARTATSKTGSMFLIAAGVGLGLGVLAVLWMFWPIGQDGYGSNLGELGLPLVYGAIAGVLMGLICCSGAHAALEIQAAGKPEASGTRQSAAAGLGAAVAAMLPAVAIAAMGLGDTNPAPFLGTALGLLVVCFAAGSAILAGLNCCTARG